MPTHSDPASLIEALSARIAALEALTLAPAADVPTPTIRTILERARVLAPELGKRLGPWEVSGDVCRRFSPNPDAVDVIAELASRPNGRMLYVEGPRSPAGIRDTWRCPIAATDPDTARADADAVLTIAGFRLEN